MGKNKRALISITIFVFRFVSPKDFSNKLISIQFSTRNKREKFINIKVYESDNKICKVMTLKNLSNVSEDENISVLIQEILGDSHINYESLFFLTIIYSIFLVVGVFGNLSTCIVILTNEYMRTATNVYLFNLAIAE